MSLVQPEYFTDNVNIPGLTPSGEAGLQAAINLYEPEALKDILGETLYDLYVNDNFASQRFIDLRDGVTFSFTLDGHTVNRKFIGLAAPKSLSVYYVYYKYISDNVTQTSRAGEVQTNVENAFLVSARTKLENAWNNYIDLTGKIPNKVIDYDGAVSQCDFFNKYDLADYEHYDDKASIYNYLLANEDLYPEWEYNSENKRKVNVLDF